MKTTVFYCIGILVIAMSATAFSQYANPATVPLGTAGTYGALAYSGITGSANVNGDIGTVTASIGGAINPSGTNWGAGGTHNTYAQTDLATALDAVLNHRPADATITTGVLGGLTLNHGIYSYGSALDLASNNTLTLDAQGDPAAIFIIKAGSTLTINIGSTVSLINNAVWSNVFWYVGSSATIFSGTTFNGNVLAVTSITLNASATLINARLLAHGGAVTINSAVLPVELVSFTAKANRMNADLRWSTATEVNNYGFEIERCQTTANWAKIGFVTGAGTSNSPRDYSYTDNNLSSGRYTYRLKQIDNNGAFSYHGSVEVKIESAQAFALSQNYPNPFNPTTVISYDLPLAASVKLEVLDLTGRSVKTLVDGMKTAGSHTAIFDASSLASGIYFYRIQAGTFSAIRRIVLLK